MPVDPGKTRKILVVHGVRPDNDETIDLDEDVRKRIKSSLGDSALDYRVGIYKYEDINDESQEKFVALLKLLSQNLLLDKAIDLAADIVLDVFTGMRMNRDGSTGRKILDGLKKRIISNYDEGLPLYIVAHSLGSLYALEAINELIVSDGFFKRADRLTWPVQGLITLGSPIALKWLYSRTEVDELSGEGEHFLKWYNHWDQTDPVVTGSVLGKPQNMPYKIAETFCDSSGSSGWFVQDRVSNLRGSWIKAHVSYWDSANLGNDLVEMLDSEIG